MPKPNRLTKISLIASVLVALPVLLAWPTGFASTIIEHWQVVAANQQWISLSDFKRLAALKRQRKLTFEEWNEWCILGQRLGFWKRCPAR